VPAGAANMTMPAAVAACAGAVLSIDVCMATMIEPATRTDAISARSTDAGAFL
jgi:hypothetical protein